MYGKDASKYPPMSTTPPKMLAKLLERRYIHPQASSQYSSKYNNNEYHRQYQQQTTRFIPRRFLVPTRAPQLHIRLPRIPPHILHIGIDGIQLIPLLSNNMRHVSEQLVQLADTLLDVPDLGFPFYDEGFLEIDFIL